MPGKRNAAKHTSPVDFWCMRPSVAPTGRSRKGREIFARHKDQFLAEAAMSCINAIASSAR
jgi:hypothetical protein